MHMYQNSEGNPKVYTFRHYDNSTFLPLVLLSNLASAFAQTKVKGKAFDRLAIIWLENTDYELAASDPNLVWLAKQGISLTNYYGLTHPSQPNYAASLSGDYYGMNHNDFLDIPDNIFTLVDLLEDKGISWAEYKEDMPIAGHDTTVTTAGRWTRNFIAPLLKNPSFMNRTLILITFDENDSYAKKNHVVAILLGDTIPAKLIGTTDTAYYNHYSGLATVEANWNLHTLGSWDVGANVFGVVAEKTGNAIRKWSGKVKFEDIGSVCWEE
ncbi:hypothetical protein CFE70_001844 [Pyrenophora teres f. teres 0-1]